MNSKEEKINQDKINEKWVNVVCPVCGEKHFNSGYKYSLLDVVLRKAK